MVEDPQIRQLAYQLFLEEVPGLLETIEQELLDLDNNQTRALKVNNLMRATHTIKGGAANVGLDRIESIAHRLEENLRALYDPDLILDSSLQSLLFDSYEYLRLLLFAKIDGTNINENEIVALAESYLDRLEERLRDYLDEQTPLPTSEELGLDPIKIFCETLFSERLETIAAITDSPDLDLIRAILTEQATVFSGMGRSFNLPDLVASAEKILTDLENSPQTADRIAKIALKDFQKIRETILQERKALRDKLDLDLIESAPAPQQKNPSLGELLTELQQFINWPNSEFYLKIVKCILGWFHRYENIALEELNLNSIVPVKFLKNSQDLEEYIEGWLNKFNQYIELIDSNPQVNLYRKLTILQAILAVIEFEYFQKFDQIATEENLPVRKIFSEQIAKLTLESQNIQLNLADRNWLNYNYLQDLIKVIDDNYLIKPKEEPAKNLLEDVWQNSDRLELFSNPVTRIKLDRDPPIAEKTSEFTAKQDDGNTPIESNPIKLDREPRLSTIRVKIEGLEKIDYLAGEISIEQNKSALYNQENQVIIEDILAGNKQNQQTLNQLCNWFDLALMFPDNTNFLQTFSNLFPKVPLNDFTGEQIDGNNYPIQLEQYRQIFKVLKNILERTNHSVIQLEKVKNYNKKFSQSFKKKQRMIFNMRAELIEARMTPLSNLFDRFPQLVERLSKSYDKQVEFKLSGSNILVDKAIEQKLYQPLLHLIRNAFAHGIESRENRLKTGKSAVGFIEISAYYQGSKTIVAVKDDGQGINLEKIKQRAIQCNLITVQQAKILSEAKLLEYMFEPGFSTSSEVDRLSGRGVGLDIVRAQLEALKGNIVVESRLHQGTTFYLQIPLTLSIAKLMVCQAGGIIYSVVSDLVQKILQPHPSQIEIFQQQKILHLNSKTEKYAVPVYKLSELISYSKSVKKRLKKLLPQATSNPNNPILLLKRNNTFLGLEIDRVLGKQELVIRPLGSALTPPSFVYGCSILGDSSLSLVIDGIALIEEMGKQEIPSDRRSYYLTSSEQNRPKTLPSTEIRLTQNKSNYAKIVLLVDDSLSVRHTTARMLKKVGYRVIEAKDGVEGLEKLYELAKINLIICDLDMPRMNGFEFLKALAQNPKFNAIPTIVITSSQSQTYRDLALQLGANAFLHKSDSELKLLDAVARLLSTIS